MLEGKTSKGHVSEDDILPWPAPFRRNAKKKEDVRARVRVCVCVDTIHRHSIKLAK